MAATAAVVDMTDVSEGGAFRPRRKAPGDYRGKIVKVDDHQPKDKTKPKGWVFTIQVEGDARSTYRYYVNPAPKEKWKIRTIMVAAGFTFNPKRIKFDPNKLVNKRIGLELEDDEYEGRVKSTIGDLFPESEVGSAGDDAPEGDDVYDEDEPEADDIDVETDDEEELEEEEPPPPPRKRTARKRAPEPEPEPEDEEDDEPEDEPEPPRRRAPAKKAAAPTKRVAKARTEPEDDDEDLDLDDLDD